MFDTKELLKMKNSIKKCDLLYIDSYLVRKYEILDNPVFEDNFSIKCDFYEIPKMDLNTNKIIAIRKTDIGVWEIDFYIENRELVYSIIKTVKTVPYEDKLRNKEDKEGNKKS